MEERSVLFLKQVTLHFRESGAFEKAQTLTQQHETNFAGMFATYHPRLQVNIETHQHIRNRYYYICIEIKTSYWIGQNLCLFIERALSTHTPWNLYFNKHTHTHTPHTHTHTHTSERRKRRKKKSLGWTRRQGVECEVGIRQGCWTSYRWCSLASVMTEPLAMRLTDEDVLLHVCDADSLYSSHRCLLQHVVVVTIPATSLASTTLSWPHPEPLASTQSGNEN